MGSEFKVGDLVRVRQNGRTILPGIYEVAEVLDAARTGERQYRVRGDRTPHERTVAEGQIRRA